MSDILLYLPDFAQAMAMTLALSLSAATAGALGGFTLQALCSRCRLLYPPWRVYVWLIRGTPFLAQLSVIYFGLPALGVMLGALPAAILSLTLYSAAYFGEIFRGAWLSIGRGQLDAARAHAISPWQSFWHIETPQALRFSLPLLCNQVILTVKESAVASIITLPELTMAAGRIAASTYSYFLPYALLIAGYWLLAQGISLAVGWLGRHLFSGGYPYDRATHS
ncbi:amino acid ABC transporter permease [Sodalis sp. RH22]|uniref:amino acid ABC transporter permease n=1 Tax=unclassified Sodalis (in: enterobacteria) TaxID=2636512 RepID=UPI0039B4448A